MTTPAPDLAQIRVGLDDLISPLHKQLSMLDEAVEQQTAALTELRTTRLAVKRTLELLDPSFKSELKPSKPVKTTASGHRTVSEENLTKFRGLLLEHADEINSNGGMNRNAIFELLGLPTANKTSFMYGMRILHDQGFMLLDHAEKARGGPLNFYKVAPSG